jgi:hypothetical protein
MLATNTGAKFSTTDGGKTQIPAPTMFKLHAGWLATDRNQVAIIIPIWREDAPQGVKLVAQSTAKDDHRCAELQLEPSSAILIFERVKYHIIPTGVPFLAVLLPTLPLEAATKLASEV